MHPYRHAFAAVLCLFALLPFPARAAGAEPEKPSPQDMVIAAAEQYATELLADPPEGLNRGEIAMAFGWIYLNDMLGGSSADRAGGYLETALDEGVPEAGVVLGAVSLDMVEKPTGRRDVAKALAYYGRAADGGCVDAFRVLGTLYQEGDEGLAPDPEKARGYLVEAAKRGSDTAIRLLTPMLGRDGLPASQDDLVVPELVAEARARSERIARATSMVFDLLEKRLERLELNIESGAPEIPLADLSRMSPEEQAVYWLKLNRAVDKACRDIVDRQPDDKSAGDAALIIGVLHHLGFLYGSDPDKAREYMGYALERGVIEARVTLGELDLDLTLDENGLTERNVARGMEHLTIAAEADSPDALRLLGLLYESGSEDIEADPEKAERYFLAAARHGDAVSLEHLQPLFEKARVWEEEHPGEKSALPTGPETVVDPALAEQAERRADALSEMAEMVNRELEESIRSVMLETGRMQREKE